VLNKRTCMACHQKHERQWEEEVWQDGYVSCPAECMGYYDNNTAQNEKGGNLLFIKSVFGLRRTDEEPPEYCDFVDGRIAHDS